MPIIYSNALTPDIINILKVPFSFSSATIDAIICIGTMIECINTKAEPSPLNSCMPAKVMNK